MHDPRLDRMAEVLIRYSLALKEGEVCRIGGEVATLPLMLAAFRQAVRAGAHPYLDVGVEDGPVDRWRLGLHPAQQGGAEIEADARVVVPNLDDAILGVDGARCRIGPVALGEDALVPALDSAIYGMKEGGKRRISVRPERGWRKSDANCGGRDIGKTVDVGTAIGLPGGQVTETESCLDNLRVPGPKTFQVALALALEPPSPSPAAGRGVGSRRCSSARRPQPQPFWTVLYCLPVGACAEAHGRRLCRGSEG